MLRRACTACTSQRTPDPATISRANSYHEHSPPPATWTIPTGRAAGRAANPTSAAARCPVNVGQPTWSSTTFSSSRSAASRRIVAGKHGPKAPNSHDERTIVWVPGASARDLALPGELRAAVRRHRPDRHRTRRTASAWSRRTRSRSRCGSSTRRTPPPAARNVAGAGAVDVQRVRPASSRRRRRRSTPRS